MMRNEIALPWLKTGLRNRPMKHLSLFVCILILHALIVVMQAGMLPAVITDPKQQAQSQARRQGGQLAGYVTADTGQPLANAQVTLTRVGDQGPISTRTTAADERGGFQFNDVPGGGYTVSARAPGYVRTDSLSDRDYYRPGDSVSLTMHMGGVITGSVRNNQGELLINVPVRAFRIRDIEGKSTASSASLAYRLTDDRGVYRLYGLPAGSYLVRAGGGSRSSSGFNKYEQETPTYYPSSTRETADKVIVQFGQEVSGINITHRGEGGHVVSGVTIGTDASQVRSSVAVALADWSNGEIRDLGNTTEQGAFTFYGVPDGEYYIISQYFPGDEKERSISRPQRIKVAGTDVSDVRLTLSLLGSLTGRVVLEPFVKDSAEKCEKKQLGVDESIISLQRERAKDEVERFWDTSIVHGVPDGKGLFRIYGIGAGEYRISVDLPSEAWFLKSISQTREPEGDAPKEMIPGTRGSLLNSISIKLGTQIPLSIILAEGAAKLNGRVTPSKGKGLPIDVSVHLVPLDPKFFENALRFFQADVQTDGGFSLGNIAPGKYRVFALVNTKRVDNSSLGPSPFNAAGRVMLRKEAQKSNAVIELRPCQNLQGYVVRYEPGN